MCVKHAGKYCNKSNYHKKRQAELLKKYNHENGLGEIPEYITIYCFSDFEHICEKVGLW